MRRKPLILVSLLLAAFAINVDTTIVNLALPSLVRQLHASDSQLQWVVDAYNLMFAAALLAAGSLSDRFGRKGMLLAGLAVFGLASAAGGLTSSAGQLIAARVVMGLGAAMVFPSTLSLISNVFTERGERALAIGLWGAITGAAIALGPIVGGWLLELFDWRSIFSRWRRSQPSPGCSPPGTSRPLVTRTLRASTGWGSRSRPRWPGFWSTRSSRPRTTGGGALARWAASRSPQHWWQRSWLGSGARSGRCST